MLKTEMRNEKTTHIDKMSTAEMVRVIQEENIAAASSITPELERIGKAVDAIYERMTRGGRLFYVGCGTSGRLGVVDASECPPTYGVPHGLVIGIIAGGDKALRTAAEGAEFKGVTVSGKLVFGDNCASLAGSDSFTVKTLVGSGNVSGITEGEILVEKKNEENTSFNLTVDEDGTVSIVSGN